MQFKGGSSSQRNSSERGSLNRPSPRLHSTVRQKGGSSNPLARRLDSKVLPTVRRLGKGLSGFLYETTWEGNKYVRKDFPLGSVHHRVFEKEASALVYLEHPNIVKCSHYTVGKSSCSLLLEYVDDDLQNFMQKRIEAQGKGKRTSSSTTLHSRVLDIDETRSLMSSRVKGSEITGADVGLANMPENEPTVLFEVTEAVDIILQIATGVECLHRNRIVHGDLKPKNVLVGSDGIVKLVDFGLVETKKRIKLVSKRTRHLEILMWKAPERFEKLLGPVTEDSDDPFTDSDTDEDEEIESPPIFETSRLAKADVYSFGLICSQILGGKLMYSNLSLIQLRAQRMHGFRPLLPSTCPRGLQILIFSTMERDFWRRPTFAEVCTTLKALQSNGLLHLMEVERKEAPSTSMDELPDESLRPFLRIHSQYGLSHTQHGLKRRQEHLRLRVAEPMAASFDNMLLKTPTPAPHPLPWDDLLKHLHDPLEKECFSRVLISSPSSLESEGTTGPHAMQQTTQGCGGMAVMPDETGVTDDRSRSRTNSVHMASTTTMSPNFHHPVAENKPPFLLRPHRRFRYYKDLRGIARGKQVALGSARESRQIRVLATAIQFALKLRTRTVMREKWKKVERKRIREPLRKKLRNESMKRICTGVHTPPTPEASMLSTITTDHRPTPGAFTQSTITTDHRPTPGASTQSTITTDHRYEGITHQNGKWIAKIRMIGINGKVWIGSFASEEEAALAVDAGYYHCWEKRETFNFPLFVNRLGESQHQTVAALCNAGREAEAKKLIKRLAAAHAATFERLVGLA